MPEVSVIIPTYNSAKYLVEAVDSVLAQTFRDFEVLVIDDGSTDDTEAVMREYASSVRYIKQENRGVSRARNRGIEESRGRWVAFLDADDTWRPNKLERQALALEKHSGYRACYSAYTTVDSQLVPIGVTVSRRSGSALEDLLTVGNSVGTPSTVMCELSLFAAAGRFDPALSQCADWDMWIRLAAHTDFLYLDTPLVAYRKHPGNMSHSAPLLERDSLLVLEKGYQMSGVPASLRARRRAAFARNYMVLAGTYFHVGRYRDFVRCAARAVAMDFRQGRYLIAFPFRRGVRLRPNGFGETA